MLGAISFAQTSSPVLQQGFSVYQVTDEGARFSCQSECLVVLDKFSGKDILSIQGEIQGNGVLGYGFLVGQQVIPGETMQISSMMLRQEWLFSRAPYIAQIPKDAQIVLIIQGSLQAEALRVDVRGLNFFQKLPWGWEDFWEYEPLTVYSINLRYGQKILGTSVVQWGYWISVIGVIVLALKRKLKLQNVLLLFGTVFLLLTIRNTREYGHIVVDEWKGFSTTPSTEAHFPVVDDLYPFMHGVRETLELDTREKKECRMYMQCIQEWPFCAHSTSLFLQPCEREPSITGNYQYLLFYKVPVPPAFSNAKVMFQMNGNTLLQK